MKRINIIFALMGVFLIIDGIFSIVFQIDEDWMYHEVRIARLIIGIMVIHIPNQSYKKAFRFDPFCIGVILLIDSIISIALQYTEPFYFQIGRFIRLGIAIALLIYNFHLIMRDGGSIIRKHTVVISD